MKSRCIQLGDSDKKAREHILESLSICAYNHILSKKLLERFSTASGPMFAIIGDWFQLDQMTAYDYTVPPPEGDYSAGDRPTERLIAFVEEYLQTTKDGIVVGENWAADRNDVGKFAWPPPRVACFGDNEVYHILTREVTDPDMIEAAIRTSHQWQTNVCSSCTQVPEGDIPDEAFIDGLVANTAHIFVPGFDGSGYLIWSPKTTPATSPPSRST